MVWLTSTIRPGQTPQVPQSAARFAALQRGSFPHGDAETTKCRAALRSFRNDENVRQCGTSQDSLFTSQKHPEIGAANVPQRCGTSTAVALTDCPAASHHLDAEINALAARLERGYDYTGPGEEKWFVLLERYEALVDERAVCRS